MRENLRQKSPFAAKIQFEIVQGEGKHGDQALSWASAHRSVCSLAISLGKSLIRFRYTIFIFSLTIHFSQARSKALLWIQIWLLSEPSLMSFLHMGSGRAKLVSSLGRPRARVTPRPAQFVSTISLSFLFILLNSKSLFFLCLLNVICTILSSLFIFFPSIKNNKILMWHKKSVCVGSLLKPLMNPWIKYESLFCLWYIRFHVFIIFPVK